MATDLALSKPAPSLSRAVELLDLYRQATAWKEPVRVASTATLTQSAEQTIDGVAVKVGERVLCKDQATASQNGIWIVRHTAWLRAPDCDAARPGKLVSGTKVAVQEGTVNAGTAWRLTTTGTIVVGTTSQTWSADANVIGPASSTNLSVAVFSGTTGKLLADGGTLLSALLTSAAASAAYAAKATFPVLIGVAMSDETTAITTGLAKVTIRAPFAFTLTAVRASLSTASSSGIPTVDINETGSGSILSTKLTIDANELTSTTAATAAVISDSAIADDAELTFDIDVAGTGAKGLKVWLIGTRVLA